ncbi:MAG TPA: hypothetical protein VGB49_01415 [Caulobacteraceae bacterium]|jgi:hypothetical protein
MSDSSVPTTDEAAEGQETELPTYRLQFTDTDVQTVVFRCPSDDAALAVIHPWRSGRGADLWSEDRHIRRFEPEPEPEPEDDEG